MKTFRKALSVVLCMLMVFSTTGIAFAEEGDAAAEVISEVSLEEAMAADTVAAEEATGFTDEDYLVVKGRKMYNKKGEHIQLKGVNLGAWLVRENWLNPDDVDVEYKSKMTEEEQKRYWGTFYEDLTEEQKAIFDPYYGKKYDGEMIYDVLEKRFGREKAQELLNMFYDNWITEWDLDNIKSMGFNCVRVPFWYRNFYYDDQGTKIYNEKGEWDFSRLDWIVEECSKREIYVILDMHGAVGSQSDAPHSGRGYAGAQLMEDSDRGERYRELTDELWTAIASRFNGNPAVAMYDLLNEPMCDVQCTEIERRIKNEKYIPVFTIPFVQLTKTISLQWKQSGQALPFLSPSSRAGIILFIRFISIITATLFSTSSFFSQLHFIPMYLLWLVNSILTKIQHGRTASAQ